MNTRRLQILRRVRSRFQVYVRPCILAALLISLLAPALPARADVLPPAVQSSTPPAPQQAEPIPLDVAADATVQPAALAESAVHMHILRPTTQQTTDCTKDLDDNPFNDPPCTNPAELVVAARVHKVEEDEEDRIVENSTATVDLVFYPLPTLPTGAVITGATLVVSGTAKGNDIEVLARNLGAQGLPQVASTTVRHDVNLSGRSPQNCYNRHQGGLYCTTTGISAELRLDLPAALLNQWYGVQNGGGQNAGLRLALPENRNCTSVVSSILDGKLTIECSFTSDSAPQLFIYYQEPTLAAGSLAAVAPSYDPERYARSAHEVRVQNQNSPWLAVAGHVYANGGGDLNAADLPLNLRSDFEVGRPVVFVAGGAARPVSGHPVNYAVVDNGGAQFGSNIWAELHGAVGNAPNAFYRLQRFPSETLPNPTQDGALVSRNLLLADRFRLFNFELPARHSLYISVTAPTAMNVGLELFSPLPGLAGPSTINQLAGAGHGKPDKASLAVGGSRSRTTISAQSTGDATQTWALALSHASSCPFGSVSCEVQIELIACPPGLYFTERWGCQSLIYPHATLFPEAGSGMGPVPATATRDLASGVRIFSEGGFEENPTVPAYGAGAQNFDYCTRNEQLGMPLLGLTGDAVPVTVGQSPPQRLIPVLQGSVCVTFAGQIAVTGTPGYGAVVGPSVREANARPAELYDGTVAVHFGKLIEAFGDLASGRGAMVSAANGMILQPVNPAVDSLLHPWDPAEWPAMTTVSQIAIDQRAATGVNQGMLPVITESATTKVNLDIDATWTVAGNFAQFAFDFTAQSPTIPPDVTMSSMTVRFHGPLALQTSFAYDTPRILELHLPNATIHQSAQMGGAHKPLQAVLLPATAQRSDGLECANAACLDLRNAVAIDNPQWEMPDIDIGGPAGMVVLQAAGVLEVYSSDHPDAGKLAAAGANAGFGQNFNFKTFAGSVRIQQEPCVTPDDPQYEAGAPNPKVTVIRGVTRLALPSLGDGADGGPGLVGEFKLCETQLRQVMLTFNAFPPGLAAGPSGVIVRQISGVVWVNPDFVRIEVATTFQSADGATFNNGSAKMVVDTRGYFALEGGARLVGTFDLDGKLIVAWNPLDILQEANLSFRDWFTGYMRLHMWRGQGWGDPPPYPWLPDDNDFHFTGAIGATFTIQEGRIGKFFGVELPRHDFEIGVEIAFGEFCKNAACTSYEWGVQGKIQVLKFTIGVYIGKSTGVKFFVGDKDRTLIDQAFGLQAAALNAIPTAPISDLADGAPLDFAGDGAGSCPEANGEATCTFTVAPNTGQALITMAWAEGTLPTAILRTPGNVGISGAAPQAVPLALPITPGGDAAQAWQMNAGGVVQFTLDGRGALYTIENPQPGPWTLTLANLTGAEAYNVLFAANSQAPQVTLQSPNNTALGNSLDVQWTLLPADSTATVQLFAITQAAWISYTQAIAAGQPVTTVAHLRSGVPIAANLPAAQGSYQWQPRGLASGVYYAVARVDHPIHGVSYSFSPGPFSFTDNTPPAVPANLLLSSEPGTGRHGLVASWDRNGEADLSAYEVVYSSPSLDTQSGFVQRRLQAPPSDRNVGHPTRERLRLVGLLAGIPTTVCVRAIDASGNRSACSPAVSAAPQLNLVKTPPPTTLTGLTAQAGDGLVATWNAIAGYDGYLLAWGYGCGAIFDGPPAKQGATNLDVGKVTQTALTGLRVGTYRVAVRGYQHEPGKQPVIGWIGGFSNLRTVVVSNGQDGNADGLPDDWAQHFGVQGAGNDADGDGLNNAFEKQQMTDPTNPDSDGDGFGDGPETFAWLTNPCDPASVPDTSSAAQLYVTPAPATSLRFEAVTGAPLADVRRLRVYNRGQGAMNWQANASAGWIKLAPANGGPLRWWMDPNTVEVRVDTTGLAPGYYEGSVRIDGVTGAPVVDSPHVVPVRLWVLRNRVQVNSRLGGYVFLDANANGMEDATETVRVADVTVRLVNKMGATMAVAQSKPNTGQFAFAQLPYARYSLLASHPNSEFVVTTSNPQAVQVLKGQEVITGIKIGIARQPAGAVSARVFLPVVMR